MGAKSLSLAGVAARRKALALQGVRVAAETPVATTIVAAPAMEARAAELARQAGLQDLSVTTHAIGHSPVEQTPGAPLRALSLAKTFSPAKANAAPSRVCVVVGVPAEGKGLAPKTGKRREPATRQVVALVMEETDGEMTVVKVLHSKA